MSLELEFLTPGGIALRTRAVSVQAADASGRFGLRPGREDFLTALVPCVVSIRDESGRESYAAVDGGILLLERGRVSVVSREVVLSDRLDEVAGRAEDLVRARRKREGAGRQALNELEASLLRQLRRVMG